MGSTLLKRNRIVAIGSTVIATIFIVASLASWWTHRVLFDTHAYMRVVGPIGTDEVVTGALADRFSDELIEWIDAEQRLESLLPPILSPLAGYGADFINGAVVDETTRFFESDFYANAWVTVNETAHRAAVAIIRDEVPNVSTEGGVVTIDLVPLLTPIIDRVFARITEIGDAIPEVLLNQVDVDETVSAIISTYEAEGLPEWLGEVEVYSSDRLAAIQSTTATLDRLVWVLPLIALVFAAGALYFAPHRWIMAVGLLGTVAIGWFAASLAIGLVVDSVVSGIQSNTAAAVATEIFNGITGGLRDLLIALAILAIICAFMFWGWLWLKDRLDESEPMESTVR